MSFTVTYLSKKIVFSSPVEAREIVGNDKNIVCVTVNNRVRELTYLIHKDAEVKALTLKDRDAKPTYDASLRYVIAMACNQLFKGEKIKFSYSISRSIFLNFIDKNKVFTPEMVKDLSLKIDEIVKKDLVFNRKKVTQEEMEKIYSIEGYKEKVELQKYRTDQQAHYYECDGYKNYMYSRMVPSSGYVNRYNLIPYDNGVIIQYPRFDCDGEIPIFEDAPIYHKTIKEARFNAEIIKAESVIDINKNIEDSKEIDFINLSEALHSRQLNNIGDMIMDKINQIKLICIAGPSSSGKTTFANRLRIELLSRGIKPIRISLDDYFKNRELTPRDENGDYDFESIDAINVDLFNKQMNELIEGKEVDLPRYDFTTGKSVIGRKLKLDKNQPLIVEGIHALNPLMTKEVSQDSIFKIFIAPQAQIRIDEENPLSLTDLRLLRRIVRDYKFRNAPLKETLDMWPNVRKGEFKWIYQTQEKADVVFNSYLPYEICVMKKYALPLLETINKEDMHYPVVLRLKRMLKFFNSIKDTWVPCSSIIREFIGGSCYQDV